MFRMIAAQVVVVAMSASAMAHGVGIEVKLKTDAVQLEAFFDDDTPAEMAEVTVSSEDGKTVATGKTDERGIWRFPTPKPGVYRVVVNAGDGHLAKTKFQISAGESAPAKETISQTASREEFTRFAWKPIGGGLGVILGMTLVLWWLRRNKTAQ